jgi:hypothetical protein
VRSGASASRPPQLAASAFFMVLHTARFMPIASFAWGMVDDACDPGRCIRLSARMAVHPYFGTEESVLWNRRKSAARKFQRARGEAAFIKCREPDSAAGRYLVGAEQGTKASACRGAIAAVREA